jgi:hypothetical protein
MVDRGLFGFYFGYVSRLVTLAAMYWPEISGAYRVTGKSLAEEDITTVCEFTLQYFINTNEYRHATRRDIWTYIDPTMPQFDEDGEDTRPIEQQMDGLLDDWDALTTAFAVKEPQD